MSKESKTSVLILTGVDSTIWWWWCKQLCWDLPTLFLPKLLHELEQTILLGLQSLYPLTLGLPLGPLSLPLSQQTLLLIPKLLQLGLQYLTPMFQ